MLHAELLSFLHGVQAAQEFSLLCQRMNIRDVYEENFMKWARAVVKYCKSTQLKCSSLRAETGDFTEELGDGKEYIFTVNSKPTKHTKQHSKSLVY